MVSAITSTSDKNRTTSTTRYNQARTVGTRQDSISNWVQQWSTEELKQRQHDDDTIRTTVELLKNNSLKPQISSPNQELITLIEQWDLLTLDNDLLYRKWENEDGSTSLQVGAPREIRHTILKQLHNSKTAGHLGREKTLSRIRERFYWPGMSSDVGRWCQTCLPCQKRKPGPGLGKSRRHHTTVNGPMECIAIDIMGPIPMTDNGNQYIMVVTDYFSKWTEAYALEDHCAQSVADKLVTEFICRFGTPTRIHTDQGREFESKLFASLCDLLDIKKSRTTPYHPQSDGMVERYNLTLQQMLSMFVNENQDDWDDHLPYLTMAYRSCVQDSTKCTPNLLMLCREISLPIDIMAGSTTLHPEQISPIQYVEWMRNSMQRAFDVAFENLAASFNRQKKYYDTKLKSREFNVGENFLRWYPPKANQKLGLGWTGPYRVNRKLSEITYEIKESSSGK